MCWALSSVQFARKSPLHEDFFLGKSSAALGDMLRIHTVALSPTPGSHSLESLLLGHLPDQEVSCSRAGGGLGRTVLFRARQGGASH